MGMYVYPTPAGNIHVEIDLSADEHYFLIGKVWIEPQEKIDFYYLGISNSYTNEPSMSPDTLLPNMKTAILYAAQMFLEAID